MRYSFMFEFVAQKRGDANLPCPWSWHSIKKDNKVITPGAKNHARAKGQEDNSKDIDDLKLQDFLQVMQPRAKSKLWANETTVVSNDGNNQATLNKETNGTSIANYPILSDRQVVGLPNNPESDKSRELNHDGVMSDIDYFKNKVTTDWSDSESSDDGNDNVTSDSEFAVHDDKDNRSPASECEENCEGQEDIFGEDVANDKSQGTATEEEEKLSNPEVKKEVPESCRLFEELEEYFSQFGSVSQVHLVVDKETKRSKGIAYIHFSVPDFAAR
ncbi:putative nucleotide-binding alpha-beta plait domain-containing protein [Medicago truncatula]|uniref:Putative nucleotide-binding alpha-beta plait domain-containing protein n=1 Tax=Medicago truncatula TaxID=3880 RepID=A0A396J2H8_MEDTR|nr:putative nucleotide-binding alpha-beta plait domain-containing protein [Medicago truncatula]